MKKILFFFLLAFLTLSFSHIMAEVVLFESFETDGNGTRYTEYGAFTTEAGNYFQRTNGYTVIPNSLPEYNGIRETWFFAAENNNGNPSLTSGIIFDDIVITDETDLKLSGFFASGGELTFDLEDYMNISVDINNSGVWTLIGSFRNGTADSGTALGLDTDFDGNFDGPVLDVNLTEYVFDIVGTGDFIDIQIDISMNGDNEEVAFDLIRHGGCEAGCPPLPVELSSFTAVSHSDEYVTLNWVTESESNLIGFNAYRAESANFGEAQRVNGTIIGATNETITHYYSYEDDEVVPATYFYWLEVSELSNENQLSGPFQVVVKAEDTPVIPTETILGNPYPTPFAVSTQADIKVRQGEIANVTVYNLLGQVVTREIFSGGNHTFEWNGKDSRGNRSGNGIYFFRMSTPSKTKLYKVVKIK